MLFNDKNCLSHYYASNAFTGNISTKTVYAIIFSQETCNKSKNIARSKTVDVLR